MSVKGLKIEYGNSVFSLPGEKVLSELPSAGGFELKVLLILASDSSLLADYGAACEYACTQLDCTKSAFGKAVDFWVKAGVLAKCDATEAAVDDEPKPAKKALASATLPTYTEGQTAEVIEANTGLAAVIDACQQISGKVFTPADAQTIVGIYDYLGLNDTGYIETLYAYCASMDKTTPRYVEKVAISMADEGINTTEALDKYIKKKEKLDEDIAKLRTLIGANARALTAKEKKFFTCWAEEWTMPYDVIERAYEITVDKCGDVKLPYMNKILENWHGEGLHTLKAVDESLEAYKNGKAAAAQSGSGIETNEFFEAALQRSRRYLEGKKSSDGEG